MNADEFLELPESNTPTELLDGVLIVSAIPTPVHQRFVARTVFKLNELIPTGEVFISLLSVYLDNRNISAPDIMWVTANSRCIVGENTCKARRI
jgi:hypothetical protein